jgi:lipopolysaccharide biosynthesis glycosyltransferase
MHFSGKALYLDSDMVVFSDVSELFAYDMSGSHIAVTSQAQGPAEWVRDGRFVPGPQYSLMVIDCKKSNWSIDKILRLLKRRDLKYQELLHEMKIVPRHAINVGLDPEWNSLERYSKGVTKLLHFTNVPSQPWRTRRNQHYDLWLEELISAVQNGAISREDLVNATKIRGIGPHVLSDLKLRGVTVPEPPQNSSNPIHNHHFLQVAYLRVLALIRNTIWRVTQTPKFKNLQSRKLSKKES